MDKVFASPAAAVADVADGASIAIAGFGVGHSYPNSLVIDMPCLQSAAQGLTANNGQLTHGQLKKLRKALKATAQKPNSAVSQAIKLMIVNFSSQITKGAVAPRVGR